MTAADRIGIAVQRLSPAGGLEQHALRLAAELAGRGAQVTLLTTRGPDAAPASVAVERLAARGRTNHGRLAAFAADARQAMGSRFARTVAFHAIPGFDFVFCANPSRARPGGLRAMLPRYRTFAALEQAAFAPAGGARFLCLATAQLEAFARNHEVDRGRLILLPPTLDRLRAAPGADDPAARSRARAALRVGEAPVWLWMGLQPHTKGLDRAIAALAAVADAHLAIAGLAPGAAAAREALRQAERLGCSERLRWLGYLREEETPQAYLAADLLVHPARADVTGTVILEAMANALPVIATAVCGYSEHVARAAAGVVLPDPFRLEALVAAARATPETRARWSVNALAYANDEGLYTGIQRAADLIMGPQAHP